MERFDDLPPLDLSIDDNCLVEEWHGQPQLMQTWTAHHADAILAMDTAKATLEVAKAIAGREIRADPADYGLNKATDAIVAGAVLEHATVMARHKDWLDAKHKAAMLSGAVDSVSDRRRALQNMVSLAGLNYYAAPKSPPTPGGVRNRNGGDDGD